MLVTAVLQCFQSHWPPPTGMAEPECPEYTLTRACGNHCRPIHPVHEAETAGYGVPGTIGRSSDSRAPAEMADLLAVASRAMEPSAYDGGRSCSPLRDSPGFSPGSLFTRRLTGFDAAVGRSGLRLVSHSANRLRCAVYSLAGADPKPNLTRPAVTR
ncbi:hypothetical protein Ntsu_21820 [Nocardia sp. IFM 10818]